MHSPLMQQLIHALRCLPGVGPKTAMRMAFHLLQKDRLGAKRLLQHLSLALDQMGYCENCRMLSETASCGICEDPRRHAHLLCVVENPSDVLAIEASQQYKGRYFVLMGRLSPLDGLGPEEIGVETLERRFKTENIKEMILATNPTVEGEATAYYLAERAKPYGIKTTRIAYGVPVGGELDYVDSGTLGQALNYRTAYQVD